MAKWKKLAAAMVVAGSATAIRAEEPPAPFPVNEEPIEIYYGTQRVTPAPAAIPDAVVPASATVPIETTRSVDSFREAMASVRDGTRDVASAAVGLLGKVGDRIKHTADTRPIIINTTAAPAQAAVAAQPQVVVVRETAESRPAVESPASIRLDVLFACGLGLAAIGAASWVGFRKSRKAIAPAFALAPIALDPNSVNLMGKYNAGPKREPAEKFDLGPTYHDELKQKEQQVEAGNTAAVEFILSQNLAFLAALNPVAGDAMVETGSEGFAVPAMA